MTRRRCYVCRLPMRDGTAGRCNACRTALAQIAQAHRLNADQAEYDRTEPARREERMRRRGRIGC